MDFDTGVSNTTNADIDADAGERWSKTGTGADTLILMPMLMLMLTPSLMVMLPILPAVLMLCLCVNFCHIAHNATLNPSTASAPWPPAPSILPYPPPTNGASQKLLPEARWTRTENKNVQQKYARRGEGPARAQKSKNRWRNAIYPFWC